MTRSVLQVRVEQEQLDEWRSEAGREGLSLSEWVRRACVERVRERAPASPFPPVGEVPVAKPVEQEVRRVDRGRPPPWVRTPQNPSVKNFLDERLG